MAFFRSNAGQSRRSLLLVLCIALFVAGGAWLAWTLSGSSPAGTTPVVSGGGTPRGGGDSALDAVGTTDRGPESARISDLMEGQPSVRLGGRGQLTGRVVDRASGEPLAGAKVDLLALPPASTRVLGRVLRLSGLPGGYADRTTPIASVYSGNDGSFAFDGVRAGKYYVEARARYAVPDSIVFARVSPSGDGGPVDVFVREGGRVIGQVKHPDGTPVPGARVALVPGPEVFLKRILRGEFYEAEGVTDEEGQFALSGIPAGAGYDLAAIGEGFTLSYSLALTIASGEDTRADVTTRQGSTVRGTVLSVGGEYDPHPENGEEPLGGVLIGAVPMGLRHLRFVEELLELCAGQTNDRGEFVLHQVPPGEFEVIGWAPKHIASRGPRFLATVGQDVGVEDFELARGPVVRGIVKDGEGRPLSGVQVRWNPVDFQQMGGFITFAPFLMQAIEGFDFPTTGSDGTFECGAFPGTPSYDIDAMKAGYQAVHFDWDPEEDGAEIELVMQQGGSCSGVVVDGLSGDPVTSFTISSQDKIEVADAAPGAFNPFSGGDLVENDDGKFAISSIKPGSARITISAPGYVDSTLRNVTIVAGQHTGDLKVEMMPGGVVRGIVIDENGAPVGGAQVFVLEDSGRGGRRGGRRGGPRGERVVEASVDAPPTPEEILEVPEEVPEETGPTQTSGNAGMMSAMRAMPPGFARYAAALGLYGESAAVSEPDGSFELRGVEFSKFRVSAAHRDYALGASDEVELTAEMPESFVEVTMARGSSLYGTVRDRFDNPVPDAIVIAMSPGMGDNGRSSGLYQGNTDELGQYRIEHIAAGQYFMLLTRGDEALDPMSFLGAMNFDIVSVPDGEDVEYDILDTSVGGCRVFGQVSVGGQIANSGRITAMSFEGGGMLGVDFKVAAIKPDGSYEFPGLSPGEYQFQIEDVRIAEERLRTRLIVDVPNASEYALELEFPESGIEVIVLSPSGEPVAEANVSLIQTDMDAPGGILGSMMSTESRRLRRRTDEKGVAFFRYMEEGEFDLTVRPPGGGGEWASAGPIPVEIGYNQIERGFEVQLAQAVGITGTVTSDEGEPLDDVSVTARRTDVEGAGFEQGRSGDDGTFRVRRLQPGTYRLTASRQGYASQTLEGVVVRDEDDKPVAIQLDRGTEVTAIVTDGSGRPLSGAFAKLVKADGAADDGGFGAFASFFGGGGTTDAEGRMALGRFGPGNYRLEAQRGVQKAGPKNVTLRRGEETLEVRIELR